MVLRHTLYYALARGLPGALAFTALAAFTRLFTPEAYGQYVLVLGWVGLVQVVAFQWLRLGLVRFLPAYPGGSPILRSTVVLAFGAAAGSTGLLAGAAALLLPAGERAWLGIGVALLWGSAWFDLNQSLAAGTQRPLRYGMLMAGRALLFLALGSAVARAGWGGGGLALAAAAAYVLPTLFTAWGDWRGVGRRHAEGAVLRRVGRYGIPLSVSLGLAFVFAYSDRVLIGELVGVREAGLYAAGYDLVEQSIGLLTAVSATAALPVVSEAYEKGGARSARAPLLQHATVLAALLVPAATGLVVLAPEVAHVVLGPAFAPTAAAVMPWVAAAALVSGFKEAYLNVAFQLADRTRRLVGVAAVAAALNVGLNVLWLPHYGLVGAAYATLASYVVAAAASWVWGRSLFPLPFPTGEFARVVVSAAAMAVVLMLLPPLASAAGLALKVIAGAIVYVGGAIALNVLDVRTRGWRAVCRRLWA